MGVAGESDKMIGVLGVCKNPSGVGVMGEDRGGGGFGVQGFSATGHGVHGESKGSRGVVGKSDDFHGVFGHSINNVGVAGETESMWGVLGVSKGVGGVGVHGVDKGGEGIGVHGVGKRGVVGESPTWQGVFGKSTANVGVTGESDKFHGVWGVTHSTFAGVFGHSDAGGTGVAGESNTGIGVHGKGGRLAGFFEGNVTVTGNVTVSGDIFVPGADCAEQFDIACLDEIEPGTVMVIDKDGALAQSRRAYDKRVAGVISGAGKFKPGIILDKHHVDGNRKAIALVGKVYCKVDADISPVDVGDLLTSSSTPGHAMKADDPAKSFGAVIGKALDSLPSGKGLLPILVCLQ